jgi:hypothetical protein
MFRKSGFLAIALAVTAIGYATVPASALNSPQPGHFGLQGPPRPVPNRAGHATMVGRTEYPMPGHHKRPL